MPTPLDAAFAPNTITLPEQSQGNRVLIKPYDYETILKDLSRELRPETAAELPPADELEYVNAKRLLEHLREAKKKMDELSPEIAKWNKKIADLSEVKLKAEKVLQKTLNALMETGIVAEDVHAVTIAEAAAFLKQMEAEFDTIGAVYQKHRDEVVAEHTKHLGNYTKAKEILKESLKETMTEKESEQLVNGNLCSICTVNNINYALPCGHVLCGLCVSKIGNKCFMCRKPYSSPIKLFIDGTGGGQETVQTGSGIPDGFAELEIGSAY